MDNRVDKVNYYLNMAETASERGTCLRRLYGAVIVKNDRIVSTGYVGAPRKTKNCNDIGSCKRQTLNIPRGQQYELCRSVHAEMNAIIQASPEEMDGSSIYLCGKEKDSGEYVKNSEPCILCKRLIINSGIKEVIIRDTKTDYRVIQVSDWIKDEELHLEKIGY